MDYPRHKQFVKVRLVGGAEEYARFYQSSVHGRPTYELHNFRFRYSSQVVGWEDASDEDPMGYDLSQPQEEPND